MAGAICSTSKNAAEDDTLPEHKKIVTRKNAAGQTEESEAKQASSRCEGGYRTELNYVEYAQYGLHHHKSPTLSESIQTNLIEEKISAVDFER